MVFCVFGCRVKIAYSFVLLITAALLADNKRILWLLFFSAMHEAGHLLSLLILGGRADELNLAFYGIGLKHSSALTRGEELVFLLSGPAVNALFCAFGIMREINAPLLLLNILPVYPLDGGRALTLYFSRKGCIAVSVICTVALLIYSLLFRQLSLLTITLYLIVFCINEVSSK